MKRPMIFIEDLSQSEIESLKKLSEYSSLKDFYKYDQVYTRTDGSLVVAYSSTVDKREEAVCTTYEEFLTKWGEYRLWVTLQSIQ